MPTAPPLTLTAAGLRAVFDVPAPPTVGVEEEVMLLHPETLDLCPCAPQLVARLGDDARFKTELPAAQLEIITPPLAGAAEVERALVESRGALAAGALGLARIGSAGVHPFAAAEGQLNAAERYERMRAEYGSVARRQLVFALQIHVAIRGADRALAVYNRMRSYLPELAALAANAPLYEGRDTGLASVRPKLSETLPRQGIPPALDDWSDLARALSWGAQAGAVPEFAQWWWELRPHPAHGTLEIRVPDAQVSAADSAAVTAVAHALAWSLALRHDAGERPAPAPTWRIAENRWSAARHGLEGELADLQTGRPRPTRERLDALLDELEEVASGLGAAAQLARARELVRANGAIAQRRVHAAAGPRGAAAWLADRFTAPPAGY